MAMYWLAKFSVIFTGITNSPIPIEERFNG